jgi:CRISP-associated protein Cas1
MQPIRPSKRGRKRASQDPEFPDLFALKSAGEVIHSRSVTLGSDRLGVVAKMDLIEVSLNSIDATAMRVSPVDYKAGAPREEENGITLWDTDRIQLGLQCLILRDNGYTCNFGTIYYRETKQRATLDLTTELESWILNQIDAARNVVNHPIPAPLVGSPKCPRCSLVTICLPDETRLLEAEHTEVERQKNHISPRRLIAARDDRRALYLNTPGLQVGRSGEVLQVRKKKELIQEFRLNDICQLSIFGNIQVSTQVIQDLCYQEIPIAWFSMGGRFYGFTRGHDQTNVFLRIEQFRLARDPDFSLQLAKSLIQGKIRNHRTMLMRNHVDPPSHALMRLKQAAEDCFEATFLDKLLGMEGAAASVYFKHWNGMIKVRDETEAPDRESNPGNRYRSSPITDSYSSDEMALPASPPNTTTVLTPAPFTMDFNGRNKRPPTDPVNAMLSLAYSLLTKDCTIAAYAVGFDPYVGFYHQPRFGKPALALDMMEEFRPLIAESVVLTAINNRIVSIDDFVRAGNAVNLTSNGRKRFFEVYEQRMIDLVTHPIFDYKVSYRRALELQFRILARVLAGEIPEYVPFTTR